MEPRIQYAKTSDGVSIAYAAMGDGPPLVYMPNLPVTNIELEMWLSGDLPSPRTEFPARAV